MKSLNKIFFWGLVGLALLALLPAFIVGSPLLVLLVTLFGFGSIRSLWRTITRGLFAVISGTFSIIGQFLSGVFRGLGWLVGWRPNKKTRFMGWLDQWKLLGGQNDGFLVDGHRKRIPEKTTYESLIIQGGMGRGKSSTFVMPGLLNLPRHKPSFVITDTSGEVFANTAGYLAKQGYAIRTLNLIDLHVSETYNPLEVCQTPQDVAELAKILVTTANQRGGKASDPFWQQAAEKLIRIMAQCLINQPHPEYRNLANLRHLITSFDAHTAPQGQLGKIDNFVLAATHNDPTTFSSYQAFVQGNLKTIQSVLMSADVALDPLGIPEIATITATNSINFNDLRQQRTALYVLVNQTQMPFYAFLLNVFYTDLFKALLSQHGNVGRLVWLFLDEFGHLTVNHFETYATTARKYKVSFALFLQSLAQLEARYGAINAKTILESIGTEIYLPGMALDTARNLEARLGRKAKGPLMSANEIIRMKQNEALMLQSNNLPIKLKTKRFYEQAQLKRRSHIAYSAPARNTLSTPHLIQL